MDKPHLNTYEIKVLRGNPPGIDPDAQKIVVFEDHSHKHDREPLPLDHSPGSGNGRAERRGVSLPDPQFINIHAAVAHILHLSGAADFIDLVTREFGDDFPRLLRPKDKNMEDLDLLAVTFAALDLQDHTRSMPIM